MKSILAALRRSESTRRAVVARLTRRLRKYAAQPTPTTQTAAPAPRPRRARLQLAAAWVGLFFLKGW